MNALISVSDGVEMVASHLCSVVAAVSLICRLNGIRAVTSPSLVPDSLRGVNTFFVLTCYVSCGTQRNTMQKQKTEGLHIRVSPKMAEKLRQFVAECGRGMSQGLFLERCFDIAGNGVVSAVQMARRMEKEPTR